MMFGTKIGGLAAAAAIASLSGLASEAARAEPCIEQIVALQQRLKAVQPSGPKPPTEPQSVGAQLDHQPTPSSVEAAEGKLPPAVGPAAALNAAQNFQAAGDEQSCLKAVAEARKMMDGK
ncbi:hypothetical protein J5J86_18800 [Aquabacter sp. L1I39]|uniref:hypothetical protein n=1 Tax=Aquabacter sp. L1I39 TaxID=2820278 RepID=UPI001ADB8B43|nr:hypothetical protein [Aquabacter sp. L1I39]QTL02803.1 hypothetical protein J5J86_18800 [Aquabacter sp. L1I39]